MQKVNFRFGRPSCQVLLLKSRHSGVIESSLTDFRRFTSDISNPTLFLSPRFFWKLFRLLRCDDKDVAYFLALIQYIRPAVVISTDALVTMKRTSMLHELSKRVENISFISVPHGSYEKGYEFHPLDRSTGKELQIESKVILASIGRRDIESYNRWGLRHRRVCPIGLLSNGIYLRDRMVPVNEKRIQICIVEHLGDPSKNHLLLQSKALKAFETLCEYVDEYARATSIDIKIAVRPISKLVFDSDSDSEIDWVLDWFKKKFKSEISFTDSSVDFSTHLASDESALTVGVDSTALLESIDRGNKVLTMWYDDSPLGIPQNDWMFLKNPSLEHFKDVVARILETDIQVYLEKTKLDRERLIECKDGSDAVKNLRNLIDECIESRRE